MGNCHPEKTNVDRGAVSMFFWNTTRRQVISSVAKFHHMLGRGFMIQRGILIFIKCLSANQNELFYMKV